MTTQNIMDSGVQQIVKKYTIVYKIIFQYSYYFIPLILGVIWARTLQSSSVIARTQIPKETKVPNFSEVNGLYKGTKISDEIGPIFNGFGDIKILGGELQATGGVLIGRNNLVTLGGTKGGIILPNKPYVLNLGFTGGLEYFTHKDYDILQLKRVIDNWLLSITPSAERIGGTGSTKIIDSIFLKAKGDTNNLPTNMEQILQILQQRMFFESYKKGISVGAEDKPIIKDKFINEYNLQCIKSRKVLNQFCDVNIDRFINKLADLDLDDGWQDVLKVSERITRPDHIDAFCSNLMINILKKPYPTPELDKIMGGTCLLYDKRYERLKTFLGVQNEIESIVSEDLVGTDLELNMFKLVSLQQKLYAQYKDKSFDTSAVITYIRFLNALINNKSITIPQFYIEESYYYNNIYLKSMLKKITTETLNPTVNDDVTKILDMISNTNKGNPTLGVIGLDSIIINTNLKKDIATATGMFYLSIPNFEQAFTNAMKAYPGLRMSNVEIDDTTHSAHILGTIKFDNADTGKPYVVPLIATFTYIDGNFVVTSVHTPQAPKTDSLIQAYLNKYSSKASFNTILELIQSNSDYIKADVTVCTSLYGLDAIPISIFDCDETKASLMINQENVSFIFNNNITIAGYSANINRQTLINNFIKQQTVNIDRLGDLIKSINDAIEAERNDDTDTDSTGIDPIKLNIMSKFNKFLGVTPKDIVKKDDKWLVSFELKGYTFATVVDVNNNYKLSPLVVQIDEQNIITVKTFSLTLFALSQNRITDFIDDPLEYIKSIDKASYDRIQQVINPTQ